MTNLSPESAMFAAALADDPEALDRLHDLRGWTRDALTRLGVGQAPPSDCHRLTGVSSRLRRVTFPEADANGTVTNIVFHAPDPERRAAAREKKAYACKAPAKRNLFPAPETIEADKLLVVEGGPDCVAGWSIVMPENPALTSKENSTLDGFGVVAIPGVGKWDPAWAARLARFDLYILLDADGPGQDKARDLAKKLARRARSVRLVAIPAHDLNRLLQAEGREKAAQTLTEALETATLVEPRRIVALPGKDFYMTLKPHDESDDLLGPLLRRNSRVGIAGFVGDGKTTLMLQMITASAYGERFFRYKGRGGDTRWLVLDLEQGGSEIKKRLDETGISARNGNVCYASLPDGLRIDKSADDREMLEDLLAQGWSGVVLDPAHALLDSEPDNDKEARDFARWLDMIHREGDFCLVVPVHTRKPVPGTVLSLADVYGRSVLTRNFHVVLGIQIWKPWESKLSILKDRSGDVGPKGLHWNVAYSHERLFHPLDDSIPGQEEMVA